jgi:hypothetical protein
MIKNKVLTIKNANGTTKTPGEPLVKKYLTIDILKKLVFPLAIICNTSCATFAYKGTGPEPTIHERIIHTEDYFELARRSTWGRTLPDYWVQKVQKRVEIRNPLSVRVKVHYTCMNDTHDVFETITELPAHTWTQYYFEADNSTMYDQVCFIKNWEEMLNER